MGKISTLRTAAALLLTILLFLCVAAFSRTTTKTLAAHMDQTVTPVQSPSPTVRPKPSPTPRPSSTPKPSPTPRPTMIPTATPIATAVPSPTIGITPTVLITPTIAHPTPVATRKVGIGPIPMPTTPLMPTIVATQSSPVAITSKKSASPEQGLLHSDSPLLPLVVGTLLTVCLGATGFIGVRRMRTAILPAIDMKKQRRHRFAHSWQRVRTNPSIASPLYAQETMPISMQGSTASLPKMQRSTSTIVDEGPKTGSHRRLGPVRLRKMPIPEQGVHETPVEPPMLPIDIEDMSFLNDPLLQDTLRQYSQKRQKQGSEGTRAP